MEAQSLDDMKGIAAAFGDLRDFWARYDRLADEFDQAMLDRLNRNLDVLLIFVCASSDFTCLRY